MGKRSTFDRRPQDAYDTPRAAVAPLLPHLPPECCFFEPCAGAGGLIEALENEGHQCGAACDIEPRGPGIPRVNALSVYYQPSVLDYDLIITNPPWTRSILHPMIEHFSAMRPTWLLFDADWMHTKQAAPYLPLCRKIVSVGRVKWVEDSPHTGKDNAAWYLFDAKTIGPTRFFGRALTTPPEPRSQSNRSATSAADS